METVPTEWTVMTWNIQGSKHTIPRQVADAIRAEAPDVIALQEVRRPQADQIAHALGMSSVWVEKHHPFRPLFPSRAEGAAILTPHHLNGAGHAVVSEATSKRNFKRRIVQWAIVQRPDHSAYRIYNAHLSPHDLSDERIAEAAEIYQIVERIGEAPPSIIVGDFNDADQPAVIAELPGIEHVPSPPTNPSTRPVVALDHVVLPVDAHSVALTVPAGGDGWSQMSDHLPVTARFSLDWVQGGFAG